MIRQSFAWWCFSGRGVGDEALLHAAREIGYEGVELIPPALWPAARREGLQIVTHAGHGTIGEGLNLAANHARITAEIRANLDLAVEHKVTHLIVFSGNRRPGLSDEEGMRITVDGLRLLAPLAEQAGVNLVLELLNSKIDHVGYQADRTAWGAEVCQQVGSPRVKLLYDVYHMQIMEGDIIRTIGRHKAHIGHFHTGGNPGRHDLDETQEIHYPAILAAIAATGYDGYVGHEFIPRGDVLQALKHAYELCAPKR